MPKSPFVAIPPDEQAQRLAARRRARYGSLLALHIVLLCAAGRTPPDIATALCCSRASGYRPGRVDREGTLGWEHDAQGRLVPPVRTTVLLPPLRRSRLALLKAPPRAYGGCRTRWRGTPLALTLQTKRGIVVSAETVRRWLHALGWVWKRATLGATDDAPHRLERLARIRLVYEPLRLCEAMVFADELDMHWLPQVGSAWMPKGTPVEVMPPGQNQQPDWAGALAPSTGTLHDTLGPRKTKALCRDLRTSLDVRSPAAR